MVTSKVIKLLMIYLYHNVSKEITNAKFGVTRGQNNNYAKFGVTRGSNFEEVVMILALFVWAGFA